MIRADVIRLYKSVHTWTGIVCGMALFIAFYAGALTMFRDEIAQWAQPPVLQTDSTPLAQSAQLVGSVLRLRPQVADGFQLILVDGVEPAVQMRWHEHPPRAEGGLDMSSDERHFKARLADGMLHLEADEEPGLDQFIYILHAVVGLPVGNAYTWPLMGIVAVLYSLALVSGVVVLLPTLVKDFLALRLGRNVKRMWLDAHNVVGLLSLPFHLVMALTSVIFAFNTQIYSAQDVLIHDGGLGRMLQVHAEPSAPPLTATSPGDVTALLPPEALIARAQRLLGDARPAVLAYSRLSQNDARVTIAADDGRALTGRRYVTLNPYDGRSVGRGSVVPGAAETTVESFFALHFGSFGGVPVKWTYFLLGLAGAWLFYSGNLLWVESRRKAQRQRNAQATLPAQRQDVRGFAAATVGVCLGCIAGLSATIAAGKWLHGHVADLRAWHEHIYYAVFFGAVVWAFLRGAARAAVELLWLSAAFTLAIPLTTLAAVLVPSLGMWAHTIAGALGVDATAFVGALCFAWMARATAQRVKLGPADSVWSVRPAEAVSQVSATTREI